MKYTLKSYDIWEQGPREKQEDSMFPAYGKASEADRLFILCDGMGGHSAGEVASSTVCEAMGRSILRRCPEAEGGFTDDDFRAALADAYDELDKHDNGAAKKMGTTLTFLKLHDRGATIAHIGDSRVYHIRPGRGVEDTEILFQTEDHSLVNDLVKVGELTREEAKSSKQKNVITRAMQPCMERRARADIYHTHDIRPGDYFMLCSDGILEQMEDDNLKYIFSDKVDGAASKVDMLIKVTSQNHDNHSAILVHITDVADPVTDDDRQEPKRTGLPEPFMAQVDDTPHSASPTAATRNTGRGAGHGAAKPSGRSQSAKPSEQGGRGGSRRVVISMIVAVVIAAAVSGGFYLYTQHDEPTDTAPKSEASASGKPDRSGSRNDRGGISGSPAAPVESGTPAASESAAAAETESVTGGEAATGRTPETPAPEADTTPMSGNAAAQAEPQDAHEATYVDTGREAVEALRQQQSGVAGDEDVADSDNQKIKDNI